MSGPAMNLPGYAGGRGAAQAVGPALLVLPDLDLLVPTDQIALLIPVDAPYEPHPLLTQLQNHHIPTVKADFHCLKRNAQARVILA